MQSRQRGAGLFRAGLLAAGPARWARRPEHSERCLIPVHVCRRGDRDRFRDDRDRYERRGGGRDGRDDRGPRREDEDRRRDWRDSDRGEPREKKQDRDEAEEEATAVPEGGAGGDGAANGKKEPLSLEELLRKKQQEQEAEAKPVFLTKKQREELALQRRQEEAEAQRQRLAQLRQGLVAPSGGGRAGGGLGSPSSYQQRDDGRGGRDDRRGDRDRGRDDRRGDRDRDGRREERRDGDGVSGGAGKDDRERQRELELIKQQYLGGERKKKKVLKATERFKFVFDWDANEDTSRDLNPLYQNLHGELL